MAMEWIDAEVQLPKETQRVLLYTPYPVFGDDYTSVGNLEREHRDLHHQSRKKPCPGIYALDAIA